MPGIRGLVSAGLLDSWSSRNFRKIVIYRERSPNIAKDRAISRNIAHPPGTCHGAGQGAASQGGGVHGTLLQIVKSLFFFRSDGQR